MAQGAAYRGQEHRNANGLLSTGHFGGIAIAAVERESLVGSIRGVG